MSDTKAQLKTSEVLSIYGIWVDRAKHEGVLYWTRFGAFFLVVSGLVVGWFKGDVGPEVRFFLVLAGSIVTTAWALVSIDGALWQEFFVRKVEGFENSHSQLPLLYDVYGIQKLPDVIFVATTLAISSVIGWLVIVSLEWINLGMVAISFSVGFTLLAKRLQSVVEGVMEKHKKTTMLEVIQHEALINILDRKSVVTKEELLEEVKRVAAKLPKVET